VARDVVSVKVAGPKCEDLTLIDLPGIVRSRGAGESETLAEDIQSLIDDYLKNPRCIILAVHPANNDFHNSKIMADAKRVDPATKRTLPVLTKPDIIDCGAEPALRDLLVGLKTDAFEKGFRMVKSRGQAALKSKETIEKCLEAEVVFFRNTQPWQEVQDRSLFGIPSLCCKLANLLMELVKSTFPAIVKQMKEEKAKSMEAFSVLASAPSSTAERRLFFFKAKDHLVESIRSNLSGITVRDSDSDLGDICLSLFHGKCTEFMEALNRGNLADISAVKVGVMAQYRNNQNAPCLGTVVMIQDNLVYIQKDIIYTDHGECPPNTPFGSSFINPSDKTVCVAKPNGCYDVLHVRALSKVRRDPDWIRKLIKKYQPLKLPIFLNTEVFAKIVAECMDKEWQGPSLDLVAEVSKLLQETASTGICNNTTISRFERLTEYLLHKVEQDADTMISEVNDKVLKE
jgi:hypothetical protein